MEIGNLLNRVQGNAHKDDQRTWEKNGWTQWEVQQRVRRYKENQTELKNTIVEIKKTQH